jgi:hypothetical protein
VMDPAWLLLLALFALVVVPIAGFAIWMWRLGARTIAEDRFPPQGVRMLGTPVELRGAAARRRGRLAQSFAVVFLALAAAFAVLTWRLGKLLEAAPQ